MILVNNLGIFSSSTLCSTYQAKMSFYCLSKNIKTASKKWATTKNTTLCHTIFGGKKVGFSKQQTVPQVRHQRARHFLLFLCWQIEKNSVKHYVGDVGEMRKSRGAASAYFAQFNNYHMWRDISKWLVSPFRPKATTFGDQWWKRYDKRPVEVKISRKYTKNDVPLSMKNSLQLVEPITCTHPMNVSLWFFQLYVSDHQ